MPKNNEKGDARAYTRGLETRITGSTCRREARTGVHAMNPEEDEQGREGGREGQKEEGGVDLANAVVI